MSHVRESGFQNRGNLMSLWRHIFFNLLVEFNFSTKYRHKVKRKKVRLLIRSRSWLKHKFKRWCHYIYELQPSTILDRPFLINQMYSMLLKARKNWGNLLENFIWVKRMPWKQIQREIQTLLKIQPSICLWSYEILVLTQTSDKKRGFHQQLW